MGQACIAGLQRIVIDYAKKTMNSGTVTLNEGDWVSINGTTGEIVQGEEKLADALVSEDFKTVMTWADAVRTLKVRTNADTPKDAEVARAFGAEGIGLCRTGPFSRKSLSRCAR